MENTVQQLIETAEKTIELRYKKGSHSVGAALITKAGKIYTGISVNSQKLDLCAEWTVIGKALTEGEKDFEMIVSIHRDIDGNYEIYPPCALCRELFLTYCPGIKVVLSENEIRVATELLPHAWKKTI
jgi:cytidine deaminase